MTGMRNSNYEPSAMRPVLQKAGLMSSHRPNRLDLGALQSLPGQIWNCWTGIERTMNSFTRITVFCLALLLLLASCGPREKDADQAVREIIASLPGIHLSAGTEQTIGFDNVPQETISTYYQQDQDIWVHIPADSQETTAANVQLHDWLQKAGAIHLVLGDGDIYWIPADPKTEHLDYLEAQDLDGAIAAEQRAGMLFERGHYLRAVDEFVPAIEAYEKAISINPDHGDAYIGLGAAYLGVGRPEQAVAVLFKGTKLLPDDYWGHRLLGNAYLQLSRYALAADELTQAYVLNPQNPDLLIGIALAQGRSDQRDLALRTLRQLRDRSDDPSLLSAAATLQLEFTDVGN